MDLATALQQSGALGRSSRVRTSDRFVIDGGLNIEDSPLDIAAGDSLGAKNYEPARRRGARRSDGYERLDGRTSPTDGDFTAITFDGGAGFAPAEGTTCTESGSGASGTVAYLDATDGNTGTVVLVNTSGTFTGGATLTVGAETTTGGTVYINDAVDVETYEEYVYHKTDYLRSLITKVGASLPCSGAVRGTVTYNGTTYAFRDNAAGTAGTMWKTSASGWTQVALGSKVYFNTAVGEISEGQTVTGLVSGATAVVRRIVLTDGLWTADGSGYFVTASITGTFSAAEALQVGGVTKANFVSSAAQTLPAAGRYYFRKRNFAGATNVFRLYGVNGVGKAFEFDGTYFVLIDTGMTVDTPNRLFVHNDHLFLVFPGGSVQNSGYQKPLNWNPITGADERSVGDDVTECHEESYNATLIATRQGKYMLYGDVVENFSLKPLEGEETGILPNTLADVGVNIYLDDMGFTTVKATSSYGNFQTASISNKIQKLVESRLSTNYVVGTVVNHRKSLARWLFDDGYGLVIGRRDNAKLSGWMPIQYEHTPSCFASDEKEDGTSLFPRRVLMGTADGYVMELDKGRSFDGEAIEAFLKLAYHYSGDPERYKKYRRAVVDISTDGICSLRGNVDYNFGQREGQTDDPLDLEGGGGLWDVDNWGEFRWSSAIFTQFYMKLEGAGFNIGFHFYSNADDQVSHTLHCISMQSSMRRINRGTQVG